MKRMDVVSCASRTMNACMTVLECMGRRILSQLHTTKIILYAYFEKKTARGSRIYLPFSTYCRPHTQSCATKPPLSNQPIGSVFGG
jgi:hypothetical protein